MRKPYQLLKCQKGITTLELLVITPFAIYILLALLTVSLVFVVKNIVPAAAREAARHAAATGEYGNGSGSWRKGVDTITMSLPTEWSVGSDSGINKSFDAVTDVDVELVPGYYTARVSYHVVTPAPGMAKMLNPEAGWMDKYITISARAFFPDEEGG